VTYQGLPG